MNTNLHLGKRSLCPAPGENLSKGPRRSTRAQRSQVPQWGHRAREQQDWDLNPPDWLLGQAEGSSFKLPRLRAGGSHVLLRVSLSLISVYLPLSVLSGFLLLF